MLVRNSPSFDFLAICVAPGIKAAIVARNIGLGPPLMFFDQQSRLKCRAYPSRHRLPDFPVSVPPLRLPSSCVTTPCEIVTLRHNRQVVNTTTAALINFAKRAFTHTEAAKTRHSHNNLTLAQCQKQYRPKNVTYSLQYRKLFALLVCAYQRIVILDRMGKQRQAVEP